MCLGLHTDFSLLTGHQMTGIQREKRYGQQQTYFVPVCSPQALRLPRSADELQTSIIIAPSSRAKTFWSLAPVLDCAALLLHRYGLPPRGVFRSCAERDPVRIALRANRWGRGASSALGA